METSQNTFASNSNMVLLELQRTFAQVVQSEVENAAATTLAACRVFFLGAGRSGLALRMAAMRMMHLGLTVYVVGEATTPAIEEGDLLVVASGSGATSGPVHAAETARGVGAHVLAITTAPRSPLGSVATSLLIIPAATKQGNDGTVSKQYAGALFEQTVLLVMDVLFQGLWQRSRETVEELWKRHANLE